MTVHDGPVLSDGSAGRVIACEACGWAHLDPLPSADELAALYAERYYQEVNPGWLEKDRAEKAFWDLEHADKLADWAELLGGDGGAVLDVGCSGGLLLEFAQEAGWRAVGVEPSPVGVEEARRRGVIVHEGQFEDVELDEGSFDVVHSKLVFEHLLDPPAFLQRARRLLRPGGVLSVQVPNDFNALQLRARDVLGKHDWWVAPPFHLNYFDFDSMERLLRRTGFTPARRDTTFPMEWFLLMGHDYVGDDALGLDCHHRRMALETELEVVGARRPFHDDLARQGLGREVIVHAVSEERG